MNKIIRLNFINTLEDRIVSGNNLLQVLLGPRQIGKTTCILDLIDRKFKNQALYESSDKVFNANADWLVALWEKSRQENKILFIDEIQKCENWAEVIKKLYDENKRKSKPVRCVLLGSSSLEIQKGLSESLTGRFQRTSAFHWNYMESKQLHPSMTLAEFLKVGGYPGAYIFLKNKKEWSDYVKNSIIATVIEKDILQFQTVKSPALFRQAFEILCSYPAQEVSYTKLLGQLQDRGNVEIIKHYLHLFEGAFLLKPLEKFSEKKIKTKSSSPKILPMSPCMYYLNHLADYDSEELGHAFEMLVGTQLIRGGFDAFYWREGKHEVDYVVREGKKVWALEVKCGKKRSQSGLRKFKELYPTAECLVIDMENYLEFEKSPRDFLEKV